MDDGGFEVDVEDAEHVDGVEGDAESDQPTLTALHLLLPPAAAAAAEEPGRA